MPISKEQKDFTQKPTVKPNDFPGKRSDDSAKLPKKESISHKAGDMLERAGEKIKNAGAESIGNAVYKAGNKLEHMNDKKSSR